MYLLVNIVNHHHLTDDGFMILLLIFLKNTLERHTLVVPSTNWLPAGYFPPTYYLNSFNPIINANVFLSSSFFSFSKSFSSSFDLLFPLTSYTLFCFGFFVRIQLIKILTIKFAKFKNTTTLRMPLIPANIYLLKVNNRNTRKRCEICSKSTKGLKACNFIKKDSTTGVFL